MVLDKFARYSVNGAYISSVAVKINLLIVTKITSIVNHSTGDGLIFYAMKEEIR